MTLNIDNRIFNFIKDENFRNSIDNFLWFYKDNIRITNTKSLLIIPCKNEVNKIGLEYKTLKDRLANQGKNVTLEVSDIECVVEDDCDEEGNYITSRFVKCNFGKNTFLCRKFKNTTMDIVLKYETMEFKNKVVVSPKIFENLVYDNAGLLINDDRIEVVDLDSFNGDFSKLLFLPKWEKFNGLDKNKEFYLFYDELGKGGNIYKAIQGDVSLFEIGVEVRDD